MTTKPQTTIIWGTEAVKGIEKPKKDHTKKTYVFENETQKAFFLLGVDESNGWLEYEVVENA
jgi:hypothetical protein